MPGPDVERVPAVAAAGLDALRGEVVEVPGRVRDLVLVVARGGPQHAREPPPTRIEVLLEVRERRGVVLLVAQRQQCGETFGRRLLLERQIRRVDLAALAGTRAAGLGAGDVPRGHDHRVRRGQRDAGDEREHERHRRRQSEAAGGGQGTCRPCVHASPNASSRRLLTVRGVTEGANRHEEGAPPPPLARTLATTLLKAAGSPRADGASVDLHIPMRVRGGCAPGRDALGSRSPQGARP